MKLFLIILIRIYQIFISPILKSLFGHACRFSPTCSAYSLEAIKIHGVYRGLALSFTRISKCHPWGDQGHDPVPSLINN